ncbi:DNA-binding transcriptional LysR family regulator [Pararhizobium capsulatum DSM 1112]|uniref:DNA-binding transcriptional LysR family regulator n=1 Tax=Pararhizobium capsulatum DSM 1112 TaxID=1121113 RepID=A0ABU0BM14_9HYPH|nr:LysR family transcriptional regulator [Pararhizobium capsulatum]MDQ0319288.1 DNA-binding transcriptional LysR family regulator [Pararhizobium capsulatum DSM 1112]
MTNLGDLEIFTRVVATGSMSAAGRVLGLSPAVISKRIKRLEDRLGTRLFQRTTRQISLTEAGQGFHDRILGVLAGIEEAEAFAAGRSQLAQGRLRITAPTSFGRMHIAPYLPRFMETHPALVLDIVLTDEFTDIVADGFDLAIRIGELVDTSLVARRLAPVRRVLCAAPGYITRHGAPEGIADLAHHICLPAHNHESWRLDGPEGQIIYRAEGPLITNSSEVIREAVISGAGIALRSTWDIGPELRSGKLVQVLPQWEGSKHLAVSALYPSRQFLPAKVRLFVDFLAGLYGPTPYWER